MENEMKEGTRSEGKNHQMTKREKTKQPRDPKMVHFPHNSLGS
jgi:hypothetical protein